MDDDMGAERAVLQSFNNPKDACHVRVCIGHSSKRGDPSAQLWLTGAEQPGVFAHARS